MIRYRNLVDFVVRLGANAYCNLIDDDVARLQQNGRGVKVPTAKRMIDAW